MRAYIYFVSFILQGFNFCGAIVTFLDYRFQVVPCITADIAVVPLGCCHKLPQAVAHPMNSRNLCLIALEADSQGWGTNLAG